MPIEMEENPNLGFMGVRDLFAASADLVAHSRDSSHHQKANNLMLDGRAPAPERVGARIELTGGNGATGALTKAHQTLAMGAQDKTETIESNRTASDVLLFEYVDVFNLVRKMIAQNLVEFLIICVIITYLIYYFSQISKVSIW